MQGLSVARLSVAQARKDESIGKDALVQGWVRTRRDSKGGFSFLELNDGSCMGNVQIIAEQTLPNYESDIKKLGTGACVGVVGTVEKSPAKGQATEVRAKSIAVYGVADPENYPIQKKGATFEFLRTVAHLRPRTNTFGAIARVRNCVCKSIHDFFQEQGFLYIHPPIITASDCEGAGQMFKVTTLDLDKPPRILSPPTPLPEGARGDAAAPGPLGERGRCEGGIDFTKDFFGRPTFLTVSGQLE